MNTFNLSLDLDKTPDVPDWVTLRQGDKSGTAIVATIYDHGVQLVGTYNARVVIGNPDGEHYYRANATYSSGVATVTVDEQTAASVAGSTYGYFEILQGSTVIASTANFGVRILPSALDGAEPGENYDNAIQDAIDGLNEAVNALPTTVEGILDDHPEWTTTVQDGSISVPKLASDVRSSLSGAILAAIGGTLVTAHDAAVVPPNALALYGSSTQSGTPTPSSPKAITSVTAAELGFAGVNLVGSPEALGVTGNPTSGYTFNTNGTGFVCPVPRNSRLRLTITTLGNANKYRVFLLPSEPSSGAHYDAADVSQPYNISDPTQGESHIVTTGDYDWMAFIVATSAVGYDSNVAASMTFEDYAGGSAPYQGSALAIDLQGHELRSLPDGTRDELRIDAAGNVTLVQRVGVQTVTEFTSLQGSVPVVALTGGKVSVSATSSICLCDKMTNSPNASATFDTQTNVVKACRISTSSTAMRCFARFGGTESTLEDFNTTLTSMGGFTVTYPLETPTETSLGAVTLPTLPAPDLTAWAAQGAELAVTYQRDATLVIAGIYAQLAPVDGPTATSNHAAGTYLMLGGTLCRVTTAIAVGETIAIGTNVVATTVMAEILALTA